MSSFWIQSLTIHLILLLVIVASGWFPEISPSTRQKNLVRMQVVEKKPAPVVEKKPEIKPIEIKKQAKPRGRPEKKTKPRKVFGATKKSITSDQKNITVKAGNTVAVEPKGKKLRPEDEEALPVPTEEYLVTDMPELVSEVVVDYPQQAREKGIEGVVVMQVLIDESGRVRNAVLLEGPGYGLNEAAMQAIYRFQFRPAKIEDRAVAVQIRYAYRFVLE